MAFLSAEFRFPPTLCKEVVFDYIVGFEQVKFQENDAEFVKQDHKDRQIRKEVPEFPCKGPGRLTIK